MERWDGAERGGALHAPFFVGARHASRGGRHKCLPYNRDGQW